MDPYYLLCYAGFGCLILVTFILIWLVSRAFRLSREERIERIVLDVVRDILVEEQTEDDEERTIGFRTKH